MRACWLCADRLPLGAKPIVQIGARTGDPARDISASAANAAAERLLSAAIDEAVLEPLRAIVPAERADAGRIFGESLPEGLRLQPSEFGV